MPPLVRYFVLAFALSWGYWIPDALAGGHWSHFPGLMGPGIAALLVTGRSGRRPLWQAMTRWQVERRWYAAALVPLAVGATVVAAQVAVGHGPSWSALATMDGLPMVGWLGVALLVLVVNGYGEETGWRGYAWPRLRARHGLPRSALLLAVPWAVWHVPTFWIDSGMRGFSVWLLPGFFVGMAAGAVVLGWIYERCGSVLVVALWHTMLNMASATRGTTGAAPLVSMVVIGWAIWILRQDRVAASAPPEQRVPTGV